MELFLLFKTKNTDSARKRVNELETKLKNLGSRKSAENITNKTEKARFLGKKGSAVYQQEYFSFLNQKNRDHNWVQKFKVLNEELAKNNPELLASLKVKYQSFDIPK
mgnify:CR=1 FL=1